MNSANKYENRTLPSHGDEVDIPVVAEVAGASETVEQSPNQPTAPPVEVFTIMVCKFSGFLLADTLTKAGTMYSVGVEKRSSRGGGGCRLPVAVTNSELPQDS